MSGGYKSAAAGQSVVSGAWPVPIDLKTAAQDCVVTTLGGDDRIETGGGGGGGGIAFKSPTSICLSTDGRSVLVTDSASNHVYCMTKPDFKVSVVAGRGGVGFKNGPAKSAEFKGLNSIRSDPTDRHIHYLCDNSSVRRFDAAAGLVSLVSGDETPGMRDNSEWHNRLLTPLFAGVRDVACTQTGKLIVTDNSSNQLRMIDLDTNLVRTIAGHLDCETRDGTGVNARFNWPRKVAFDRSPTTKPFTVLFVSSDGAIRRIDLDSMAVTTIKLKRPLKSIWGISCLPCGVLIVTCYDTHSLYLVYPPTGDIERLIGSGEGFSDGPAVTARFSHPMDVAIDDHERCAYVCDSGNRRIRRVGLPACLFSPTPGSGPLLPVHVKQSIHSTASTGAAPPHASGSLAGRRLSRDRHNQLFGPGTADLDFRALFSEPNHRYSWSSGDVTTTSCGSSGSSGNSSVNSRRSSVSAASFEAHELTHIQSDIKSIWDAVLRLSNQPQTIGAIGTNATTIKGMKLVGSNRSVLTASCDVVLATKELRDLTLKLEACMDRLDAAISEMQSERETLNHYKQLVSSLYAELKPSTELASVSVPTTATAITTTMYVGAATSGGGNTGSGAGHDVLNKMRDILCDFQKQQPKLVSAIEVQSKCDASDGKESATAGLRINPSPKLIGLSEPTVPAPVSHAACEELARKSEWNHLEEVLRLQGRLGESQKLLAARDQKIHSLVTAHAAELTRLRQRSDMAEAFAVTGQASSVENIKLSAELKRSESHRLEVCAQLSIADVETQRVQSALKEVRDLTSFDLQLVR